MKYSLAELSSLETILENTGEVYWVFDGQEIVKQCCGFDEFFYLKGNDIRSEVDLFKSLVVKEDLETLNVWHDKINNGLTFKSELKLVSKNNEAKWYRVNSIPVKDESNAVKYRVGFLQNISSEKNKDDELYEVVERYESFISHTSEGIFRVEFENPVPTALPPEEQILQFYNNSYIAECNLTFAKFFGSENIYEIIGKKLNDIQYDDHSKFHNFLKDFIVSNYQIKNRVTVTKDSEGNDLFINNNIIGIIEKEKLVRCWGTLLDITKQIEAEKKAKILTRAVEQSQLSIIITDIDGKIEYVNTKFTNLSGYKLDDVIGKNAQIFKCEEHEPAVYDEICNRISKGQEWNGVLCNKKKNGENYWESVNISPIKNSAGEIINYLSVKEDITESIKIQEELDKYRSHLEEEVAQRTKEIKDQYTFLNVLIESLPIPVYVLNEKNEYRIVNKSFEEFTLLKKEELIGKELSKVGPDFLSVEKNIRKTKIINRDNTEIFEIEIKSKSALPKNVVVYQTKLNYEGTSSGMLGVVHDITERKNLEIQTKNALQKERELNQMKTNFISMVSHEFRTPLTAILTTAEFIERYYDKIDKEKMLKQIKNINISVDKMTSLLEDIIFLSRKERGKLEFNPGKINVKQLAERTINDVSSLMLKSQSIEFDYQLPAEIYTLDEKLLYIILSNLLTNAVKYSPENKKIEFSILQHDDLLKFSVADHGIGIKPADHDKIFEPFYRAPEVNSIPGSGLGLPIVKEAVETHGGRIIFESAPNRGTKFDIFLPFK